MFGSCEGFLPEVASWAFGVLDSLLTLNFCEALLPDVAHEEMGALSDGSLTLNCDETFLLDVVSWVRTPMGRPGAASWLFVLLDGPLMLKYYEALLPIVAHEETGVLLDGSLTLSFYEVLSPDVFLWTQALAGGPSRSTSTRSSCRTS